MIAIAEPRRRLQRQLTILFLGLIVITGINGFLFWNTLKQTFMAQEEASRSQYIISVVSDLERSLIEEERYSQSGSTGSHSAELAEIRKKIGTYFTTLNAYETDKAQLKILYDAKKSWEDTKGAQDFKQVHLLTSAYIQAEKNQLNPWEKILRDSSKNSGRMFGMYLGFFAFMILVLNFYFRRLIFFRLSKLSNRMNEFQAGHASLPSFTSADDEIGHLESQFYMMAGRITDSFSELKELDQVKTDFLSIASHELRTPMTSVKGSLSLILSGSLCEVQPEARAVLMVAEKETDRLIRLINEILDLTKIEAKKLPMVKKEVMIDDVIQAAVQGLSGLLDSAKIRVEIQNPSYGLKVNCDGDRIQQVITNLLSNSVKFSPAGSTIQIIYFLQGREAMIQVVDKGPGIKPEDQSKVFDKFTSADSGKARLMRGTGLGLPICKGIVEQHGGHIGLRSQVGVGSIFYFTLPEAKAVKLYQSEGEAA